MPCRCIQYFLKISIALIEVKKIPFIIIIGYIDVGPVVVIQIAYSHAQPKIKSAAVNMRLFAYICKIAILVFI